MVSSSPDDGGEAEPYEIGEEIGQHSLAEAIDAEASISAEDAGSDLLQALTAACREQLRKPDQRPMTRALARPGDTYQAPDGVRYSLLERAAGPSAHARGSSSNGAVRRPASAGWWASSPISAALLMLLRRSDRGHQPRLIRCSISEKDSDLPRLTRTLTVAVSAWAVEGRCEPRLT